MHLDPLHSHAAVQHWALEEHQHQAHGSAHTSITLPVQTAAAGLPGTSAEVLLQETMAHLIPLTAVAWRQSAFRSEWFLPRIFELSLLLTHRRA